jgi:hypothetical protein
MASASLWMPRVPGTIATLESEVSRVKADLSSASAPSRQTHGEAFGMPSLIDCSWSATTLTSDHRLDLEDATSYLSLAGYYTMTARWWQGADETIESLCGVATFQPATPARCRSAVRHFEYAYKQHEQALATDSTPATTQWDERWISKCARLKGILIAAGGG